MNLIFHFFLILHISVKTNKQTKKLKTKQTPPKYIAYLLVTASEYFQMVIWKFSVSKYLDWLCQDWTEYLQHLSEHLKQPVANLYFGLDNHTW